MPPMLWTGFQAVSSKAALSQPFVAVAGAFPVFVAAHQGWAVQACGERYDLGYQHLAEGLLAEEGAVGEAGDAASADGFDGDYVCSGFQELRYGGGEDVHPEGRGYVALYLLGWLAVDPDLQAAWAGEVEGCFLRDCGDGEAVAEVVRLGLLGDGGEGVDDLGVAGGVVWRSRCTLP